MAFFKWTSKRKDPFKKSGPYSLACGVDHALNPAFQGIDMLFVNRMELKNIF